MILPARVGVITTSYPRWRGDGAGGFVAEHVESLRAAGVDVEVIAAAAACDGEAGASVPRSDDDHRTTRIRGGRLFYTGGAPDAIEAGTASTRDAIGFSARLTLAVARRAHRWDAVIAHWLAPCAIAGLPTRGPLLAIAHGGDIHLLIRTRLLAPVIAALALRRARVVFVSADLAARTRAALPLGLAAWVERSSIIQPMGVNLDRFAGILAAPAALPTIAVLARLVPIKGVDVVIDAMASVAQPARLVIAGAGPAGRELAARAARISAATGHTIELPGALDADHRDALLAAAAVVVVPSRPTPTRVEAAPVAALEALAAGRPVIAAATGGLVELPAPVRLVPPDDPGALGRAIDDALRAPPGPEACRAAARDRDWQVVATRLHHHWLGAHTVTHHARK